jgi:hypothetical protein
MRDCNYITEHTHARSLLRKNANHCVGCGFCRFISPRMARLSRRSDDNFDFTRLPPKESWDVRSMSMTSSTHGTFAAPSEREYAEIIQASRRSPSPAYHPVTPASPFWNCGIYTRGLLYQSCISRKKSSKPTLVLLMQFEIRVKCSRNRQGPEQGPYPWSKS